MKGLLFGSKGVVLINNLLVELLYNTLLLNIVEFRFFDKQVLEEIAA